MVILYFPMLMAAGGLQGILEFFITGGVFMIPLILCSIAGVAIIILRASALRESAVLPPAIEREIVNLPAATPPQRLARMVTGDASPLARIVRVALENLRAKKVDNVEAVQIRARQEMLHLESGLVVLELIVGLGPLLGLLGAVSGLVGVFGSLGPSGAGSDPLGVAKGIAEALHTTIMGLAVAIPSLVAHSYFSKKVEVYAIQMEALIASLLTKCYGDTPELPSKVAVDLDGLRPQDLPTRNERSTPAPGRTARTAPPPPWPGRSESP